MMPNIVRMMEMMVVVRENAFYLPKLKNFCRKVTFSLGKNKKGIVSNNCYINILILTKMALSHVE